jgi:hypothetical protein
MESSDLSIVDRYHSEHSDRKNFTSFYVIHERFKAMVDEGNLSPPKKLED